MAKITVVSCDHCGTTTEKVFHFDRVTREGVFVIENQDYCLKCLAEVLKVPLPTTERVVEKIVQKVVEVPSRRIPPTHSYDSSSSSSSSSSGRSGATGRPLIMEEEVRTAPLVKLDPAGVAQSDSADRRWSEVMG